MHVARVVHLLGSTIRIGLVGPMLNYATAPQLVEKVPYRNFEEMDS